MPPPSLAEASGDCWAYSRAVWHQKGPAVFPSFALTLRFPWLCWHEPVVFVARLGFASLKCQNGTGHEQASARDHMEEGLKCKKEAGPHSQPSLLESPWSYSPNFSSSGQARWISHHAAFSETENQAILSAFLYAVCIVVFDSWPYRLTANPKQNYIMFPRGRRSNQQHRILEENTTLLIWRRKRRKSRQAGCNLRMLWTSHVQGHCQPLRRYSGNISTLSVLLSLENYLISIFTLQCVTALEAHKPEKWLFFKWRREAEKPFLTFGQESLIKTAHGSFLQKCHKHSQPGTNPIYSSLTWYRYKINEK